MMKISEMPKYEVYKDSGVEWIGAIPVHWNSFPLCAKSKLKSISNNENEELLSVYLDKGVIKFDDVDAKRTNTTSSDLTKYQLVDPGDFVLNNQQAWRGSVGVSDYRGIVSPAYLVLSLSEDIVPRFGNYLFRDGAMVANYLVSSKGVGTIQRNLYWPQLKRALVFLPPTEEQLLIANFLDKKTALIDEAISIKEQQINLLKERKQIIIQQAVTQGLDPNVPMKDSGVDWIGKIPAHWKIKPLKHILKLQNVKIEAGKSNLEYLGMECVNSFDGTKNEIKSEADGLSTFFQVGNILFGKLRPYLAKVYLADFEGVCSTEFLVYEVKVGSNTFFSKLMLSNGFISVVDASTYGSKMPRASSEFIGNLKLVNPPLEEQIKIASFIDKQNELFDMNIALQKMQIEKLKEYKTTLINSAVTGKIKITPEMVEQ